MSNDQGEAIFHAAKLLQLYEETESIEAVTEAATALLAKRPLRPRAPRRLVPSPELTRVLPKQHRARIVPTRPPLSSPSAAPGAAGSRAAANDPQMAAANLLR
jgi:hypothetical protein